jgi:hypothetical protein
VVLFESEPEISNKGVRKAGEDLHAVFADFLVAVKFEIVVGVVDSGFRQSLYLFDFVKDIHAES